MQIIANQLPIYPKIDPGKHICYIERSQGIIK